MENSLRKTADNSRIDFPYRKLVLVPEFFLNLDQLLYKIAQNGCQESFKCLFQEIAPKLLIFAKSNHLSESQAKDLVQDVMTLIWTKSQLFDGDKGKAESWIFTIARNVKYDLLRKQSREQNFLGSEDIWPLQERLSSTKSVDQLMHDRQIRELVNDLPESQKQVITSVYFEGLTQEECADRLEIPLGTVKSRLRLALNKLNQVVEK